MQVSDNGIKLIKYFEGVRKRPYKCSALLWTCGVGHVLYPEQAKLPMDVRNVFPLKPEDSRAWSDEEIDKVLRKDLARFERAVAMYVPVPLRQNEFDAILSATFNMGNGWLQRSSMRQALLRNDKRQAMESLMKCCKAGGKVIKGLELRRLAEKKLFES